MFSLNSKMSFKTSAILPAKPTWLTGRRTEKSPFLKAKRAARTWLASRISATGTARMHGLLANGEVAYQTEKWKLIAYSIFPAVLFYERLRNLCRLAH